MSHFSFSDSAPAMSQTNSEGCEVAVRNFTRVNPFHLQHIHYATTTLPPWRRRIILLDGGRYAPCSACLHYSSSSHGSLFANSTVRHHFFRVFSPIYLPPALPEPITDLWVSHTLVAPFSFLTMPDLASTRKPVFPRFQSRRFLRTSDTFLKTSDFARLGQQSMLSRINGWSTRLTRFRGSASG